MSTVAKINTPGKYVFGRPAMYDLKKLAEHLDEWSKDYRNWDLCKWVDEADVDPTSPSQWAKNDDDFRKAWNKAKNRIAARRTEMATIEELPMGIYNKYQHNYDVMHHEFEEETKDRDAARKKDIEGSKQSTYQILVPHDLAIGSNLSAAPLSNKSDQST